MYIYLTRKAELHKIKTEFDQQMSFTRARIVPKCARGVPRELWRNRSRTKCSTPGQFHAIFENLAPDGRFMVHCNVGATADTFGCWHVGGNHFKTRYWQNQAEGARCSAWKISKVKQKGANWKQTNAKSKPKGNQNVSTNRSGFRPLQKTRRLPRNIDMLAPLGQVWKPFWRPLDFEGPIRLVFLDVFGATAKTRNI